MKQQGVSYSINYVFTCGQRRVRICRNIQDYTNNPDYLFEEGSNKQGVLEGLKNENNCGDNRWVISSQKQLVSIESNINDQGHGVIKQMEECGKNRMKGGCTKNSGQGHNLKKCQCQQSVSIFNSQKINNCSQIQGKDISQNISSSLFSQFSVQSLKLITDFYIHKISDDTGVLSSHLLVRVEDIFFDLDQNNHNNVSDHNTASRTYAFNRRTLNGFLFKKCGFYMQFEQSPKSENFQNNDDSISKSSSFYPNFTDLSLKNDNFTFKFVFVQTEDGFSVDGALVSDSPLVQTQEQLQYKVNILQNELQQKHMHQAEFHSSEQAITNKQTNNNSMIITDINSNLQQTQNNQELKKIVTNNEHKNNQQKQSSNKKGSSNKKINIDTENHKLSEEADDYEDTQSSSLTLQINNNSRKQEQENDYEYNSSIHKQSQKQNTGNSSQTEKGNLKKLDSDNEKDQTEDISKKSSSKSKKNSRTHKQSITQFHDNEEEQLREQDKHISDKIDEDEEDNDLHSCISSTEHNKNNSSHNEDQTSNPNHNSPVQPKKNVVKNFVKAFRNFVQNWGDENKIMEALGITTTGELNNFRLEYKKFESISKFNNTFIKALILNEPFKPVFNYFVNEVAWEWLDKSQVNNKKAHKDVLNDYVKATKDPSRIEEIHSLRTRNRQSISKRVKTL